MLSLRKLTGIVLLTAIASIGLPSAFAGPQESPGIAPRVELDGPGSPGPQESPGFIVESVTGAESDIILPLILRLIP